MTYKLSVIIPTYNGEDYLMEAINSLKAQNIGFENIEVILVDDNSQDNTKNILKELSNEFDNVKAIFSDGNSGTASAPRNIGIKNSTTDFIMFLDNDDEYYPEMCQKMYDTITEENADVVTCRYDIVKEKIDKPNSFLDNYPSFIKIDSIDEFPDIMSLGFPTMIWTKIYRKDFILKNRIEFPKGHLYEDVYFTSCAYLYADAIVILNDFYGYKYNVRIKGDNKSTSQVFTKSLVEKQLNGFLDVSDLIKDDIKYPYLYNEIIVDMTKIYLYADLEKDYQKFFLDKMKPFYRNYKLNSKIHTASLPFNIIINIFVKIFAMSNFLAILTSNIYSFIKRN